jgi:hypothetical protein
VLCCAVTQHHYVEAEERESFLFAARDAEEGSAWCEALTKALQDVKVLNHAPPPRHAQ